MVPPVIVWGSQKSKTKKWKDYTNKVMNSNRMCIAIINTESFQATNKARDQFLEAYLTGARALCILDESSYIKSPKALRTKNLMKWRDSFTYRLILTGTDITRDVLDYYEPMRFAVPRVWSQHGLCNYYAYRSRYAILRDIPLQQGRRIRIVAGYQRIDELIERIQPYIYRVRKQDCLDLPEKIHITVPIEMNIAQKRVYDQFVEDMITEYSGVYLSETQTITVSLRASQLAGGFFPTTGEQIGDNNKIKFLLNDLSETSEKAIIWAAYRHEVNAIAQALRGEYGDMSTVVYSGKESHDERSDAIERFRGDARFFVATPQSGGFGLNLQFCTLQYWYSRTQRMDVNLQAEDRSHRIGTRSAVVYKHLVTVGTIDEVIRQRDQGRRDLLEGLQTNNLRLISNVLGIKSIDRYKS